MVDDCWYDEDVLREWAFMVEIESTRQIGCDRIRIVLLRLVEYAAGDGLAFPSAETLAGAMNGYGRRDVRNAFDALESQGLIERVPGRRKSVTWRVLPDGAVAGNVAGCVAGDVAGDVAGTPATNRTEVTSLKGKSGSAELTMAVRRTSFARALEAAGLDGNPESVWAQMAAEGIKNPDAFVEALDTRGELGGYLAAHIDVDAWPIDQGRHPDVAMPRQTWAAVR